MLVSFANNQTLGAIDAAATEITTDPHPIGDANHLEVSFNVHRLFTQTGGTISITWAVEGSNDGQNFYAIGALTASTTAEGLTTGAGDLACVFIRFKFTLQSTTGTGISATTFDCHGNLKHI